MGCPSFQEGLIIALVLMIVLGASRLPQIGDGLGKAIRNFRKGIKDESKEPSLIEESQNKESHED